MNGSSKNGHNVKILKAWKTQEKNNFCVPVCVPKVDNFNTLGIHKFTHDTTC